MLYNNICSDFAELCKGSTADSDSVCLGSNPSSAAKKRQVSTETCRFFIQSEGLVCNRRQAYVISEAVCYHRRCISSLD